MKAMKSKTVGGKKMLAKTARALRGTKPMKETKSKISVKITK